MDLPHQYVRYMLYVRRERTGCIVLLVHQDGHHAQKYHGVMQTYIIFHHEMKTLCMCRDKGQDAEQNVLCLLLFSCWMGETSSLLTTQALLL